MVREGSMLRGVQSLGGREALGPFLVVLRDLGNLQQHPLICRSLIMRNGTYLVAEVLTTLADFVD